MKNGDGARSLGDRLLTNPFWAVVILTGTAFAVTCLVSVAATLGDPQGPMNQLMNSHGIQAITIETAVLVFSGLGAMTLDRIQTMRNSPKRLDGNRSMTSDETDHTPQQ